MISVIVPIYNEKEYLSCCIESILNQSFANMEILLIDDGSTDGSSRICDEYAKKDSRIRVVHKENGGVVSARKAGIRAAKGEYIAYVDGDDWIEPNMYERMYETLVAQDVDVVMCGIYEDTGGYHKKRIHGILEGYYGKTELLENVYPQMIVGDLFFEWRVFPGVWDKLFKRTCVEEFQLAVDERIVMGEDAACTYPCLLHANSIYVMSDCLYHYRQSVSSMVKKVQDYDKEKEQFGILYRSVNNQFTEYREIYDMRQQWEKYVLFLVTPRADGVYKGYKELDYLYPFPQVKKGARIVLYGAGTYGQRLFQYLEKTGFCKVVAWVDQNYGEYRKMGLEVDSPQSIQDMEFDKIVVAITYAKPRFEVFQILTRKYDAKKVVLINEELICSEKSKRAMGLY